MTISWALRTATHSLSTKKIPMAYLDAELLLAFVLKKERTYILAHDEQPLTQAQLAQYQTLIKKRAKRTPLAYIVGAKEFYGLSFAVSPIVLIPRPDSEELVSHVLTYITDNPTVRSIVDVGTGSGCIPLAIAVHTKKTLKIDALDISPRALTLAKKNAKSLKLDQRVQFAKKDLLKNVRKTYDVIIANLPYLSKKEYAFAIHHFPEIKYEPKSALLSGTDGLDLIRILLSQAPKRLNKHGVIFLEIGYEQGNAVKALATTHFPTADITIYRDDCGRDRVVMIQT